MVMSLQVSWQFFKAVRAGLAVKRPYLDPYGPSEQRGNGGGPEGCVENGPAAMGNVSASRRIGVSACRRLQSIIYSVGTSWSLLAVPKGSLTSPDADTPTRRPADTLPQPPAHFQRNPPGRGQLAVFPRCSLDPYECRYGRFTASPARTALKNSQLTCGDITIICETVH